MKKFVETDIRDEGGFLKEGINCSNCERGAKHLMKNDLCYNCTVLNSHNKTSYFKPKEQGVKKMSELNMNTEILMRRRWKGVNALLVRVVNGKITLRIVTDEEYIEMLESKTWILNLMTPEELGDKLP